MKKKRGGMLPAKTAFLKEAEGIRYYRIRIRVPSRRFIGLTIGRAEEYVLGFEITRDGVLTFDNRQAQAAVCSRRPAARTLAGEMLAAARHSCPGALTGRTLRGLHFELDAHYRAYRLGLLMKYAVVTDIGGTDPAAPDYDSNGAFFEHPLRNIPQAFREFLKRIRERD
jgi:hypothetical protein